VPLFLRALLDNLASDGLLRQPEPGRWVLAAELPEPLPVPERVAGLFERQFVALAPAQRELLEAAAVAGVEFDAAVLAAALDIDADEVHTRCDGLVRGGRWLRAAGLVHPPGAAPAGRYRFGHALMHGLCASRVGAARRIDLHRRVAAALMQRHVQAADEVAAELAYHHEQARDAPQALAWLRRCVAQAAHRQAPLEVLRLAERALTQIPACQGRVEAADLARWRAQLLQSRASALSLSQGPGSPGHQAAITEAVAAADALDFGQELLNLHRIHWLHLVVGGHFDQALAQAERVCQRADAVGDATCQVQALSMLHFSAFKTAAFACARATIARADALAAQVQPASEAYLRFFAQQAHERALLLALMDVLEQRTGAGVPAALVDFPESVYSPAGRLLNGLLAGLGLAWLGEAEAVAQAAERMLALAEREALNQAVAAHRVLAHWAAGVRGDAAAALPALQVALAEALAGWHVADRAALHELAADLAQRAGQPALAVDEIERALSHVQATGERYLEARLVARRQALAQRPPVGPR
jgi:hypothetical protein